MKHSVRVLSLLLIVCLCFSGLSVFAGAAAPAPGHDASPLSNAYIAYCYAALTGSGKTITIDFTVTGTKSLPTLGASCIKLYTTGGEHVTTFWSTNNPNMLASNTMSHSGSLTYTGTRGTSYYAVATFFGKDANGNGTDTYTTGILTL